MWVGENESFKLALLNILVLEEVVLLITGLCQIFRGAISFYYIAVLLELSFLLNIPKYWEPSARQNSTTLRSRRADPEGRGVIYWSTALSPILRFIMTTLVLYSPGTFLSVVTCRNGSTTSTQTPWPTQTFDQPWPRVWFYTMSLYLLYEDLDSVIQKMAWASSEIRAGTSWSSPGILGSSIFGLIAAYQLPCMANALYSATEQSPIWDFGQISAFATGVATTSAVIGAHLFSPTEGETPPVPRYKKILEFCKSHRPLNLKVVYAKYIFVLATIIQTWRDVKLVVRQGNPFDPISGLMTSSWAIRRASADVAAGRASSGN
jgi:hypothetical protein